MGAERGGGIALPRKQHRIVSQAVERWRAAGIVDEPTGEKLLQSLSIAPFDWQRVARYSFIVAIVCFVIAVGALLADRLLMELLRRLFSAPAIVKCALFAAVAAALFRYGLFLRGRYPHRRYSNEAVFFLGVLALAGAIAFLGVAIDTGSGHYSLLFLLAAALYLLLGLWFPSALVWVFGLLALGSWMGTETGYVSGYGAYWLGMNYPLRFVIFGASLTLLALAGEHAMAGSGSTLAERLVSMTPQTKVMGLLYLFIALWILSIFGNYGDMMAWRRARQVELLHWSLVFGAAAVAAIWYGLKRDDGVLRGFGLTFLFINLYTRFFEYFWDTMHKAFFFLLLAVTLWYLGRRAETIWRFGQAREGGSEDALRESPRA